MTENAGGSPLFKHYALFSTDWQYFTRSFGEIGAGISTVLESMILLDWFSETFVLQRCLLFHTLPNLVRTANIPFRESQAVRTYGRQDAFPSN